MSAFTTEVRYICEHYAGYKDSVGFEDVDTVISKARGKVFNFNYPIFDESYRVPLETKILRHYYTREICEETVGLWKLRLQQKLNEVMPYYNQLYKSALITFNPLYDVDLTTTHSGEGEKTSNGSTSGTSSERIVDDRDTTERITDNGSTTLRETGSGETTTDKDTSYSKEGDNSGTGSLTTSGNGNETFTAGTRVVTSDTQVDDATTTNTANTSTSTVRSTDTAKLEWNKYSETPQGAITDLEADTYLTNARKINGTEDVDENIEVTGTSTGSTDYDNTTTKNGTTTNSGTNTTATTSSGSESTTNSGEWTENGSGSDDTTVNTEHTLNRDGTSANTRSATGTDDLTRTISGNTAETNNATINSTDEYLNHVLGKSAGRSYSKLLSEYRETFLNIDRDVIRELANCFFLLWEV